MMKIENPNTGRMVLDISGQRFGRLVAIDIAHKSDGRNTYWNCKCDCGRTITTQLGNLRSGRTTSCGCYHNELTSSYMKGNDYGKRATRESIMHEPDSNNYTRSNDRLYKVYRSMLARCYYLRSPKYKSYGALGVKVCEAWKCDFNSFRQWAIDTGYDYEAPFGKCTLDRIDPYGNYEPSNCRWADMKTQNMNKRRHKKQVA